LEDVVAALHLAPPGWLDAVRQPVEDRSGIVTDSVFPAPPRDGIIPASDLPPDSAPFQPRKQGWLFFEIYAELRVIVRMFFDPRYAMSWQTRLLAPLMIVGIIVFRLMVGSIPIIGGILDVVLYPVLLYVLFKVLSREATRYRLTSSDLPPAWRL
jgi:hypothetical protein